MGIRIHRGDEVYAKNLPKTGRLSMPDALPARITCAMGRFLKERNSDSVRSLPRVKTIINRSISALAGSLEADSTVSTS
jgi:hypothetical protein